MNTPWRKIVAAAIIVGATPASAIPVTFDFTGTVRQTSDYDFATGVQIDNTGPVGASFTAQFIVDTDLFAAPVASQTEFSDHIDFSSQLPGAITSNLVINGEAVSLGPHSTNSASVGFGDSYGLVDCGDGCTALSPDQWGLGLRSEEITAIGRTALRTFGFTFAAEVDFTNPSLAMGWLDLSQGIDLDQIATLPMLGPDPISLYLFDYRYTCAEDCFRTGVFATYLEATSVTRTVASVPEPGSLGLLAMGLAGAWFARRRQVLRT